jgi:hypothetical protein
MTKSNRLFEILDGMSRQLKSRSVTIKIRTGWSDKAPIAHELIPQLQRRFNSRMSAIMVRAALSIFCWLCCKINLLVEKFKTSVTLCCYNMYI